MDRVRLGRALGYGTRHAAKTFAAVVEAAASPDAPRTGTTTPDRRAAGPRNTGWVRNPGVQQPGRARGLRESFLQPLAIYSRALWLRVTGVFFALIAFSTGSGAWRARAALHGGTAAPSLHRFWIFTVFAALFGYFTVSSFIRANLIERRAAAQR